MKFVKGDAIAGIVITLINVIGGITIGVMMHGLTALESAYTYSLLSIGDGLVTQIPALLISITAGIVTTRVSNEKGESNLGSEISGQILNNQKRCLSPPPFLGNGDASWLSSSPFMILASALGLIGYALLSTQQQRLERAGAAGQLQQNRP